VAHGRAAQAPRVYRVGYLSTGTSNPRIFQFFQLGVDVIVPGTM
jgi:hypothetical protein